MVIAGQTKHTCPWQSIVWVRMTWLIGRTFTFTAIALERCKNPPRGEAHVSANLGSAIQLQSKRLASLGIDLELVLALGPAV